MRIGGVVAVCAACLALSISAGPAQAAQEFALEYQVAEGGTSPAAAKALNHIQPLRRKPYSLKKLPEGVSRELSYFAVQVGRKRYLVMADLGEEPRLFVDVNADQALADETPLTGTAEVPEGTQEGVGVYTFDAVTLADGPTLSFQLIKFGRGLSYLAYGPAGVQVGQVEAGGGPMLVHVADGNMDGRYDGVFQAPGRPHDWIGIDLDGNGTLDTGDEFASEVLALSRVMRIGDSYYEVAVQPDGSSISIGLYEGPMGSVEATDPDAGLSLTSPAGVFTLMGNGGKWQLPVERYRVKYTFLSAVDENGDRWTLLAGSGGSRSLRIKEGEVTSVKMGAPLDLQAEAQSRGRGIVSVGLTVRGQGRESYRPGAMKNGETMPAPRLKILDEEANELVAASFE